MHISLNLEKHFIAAKKPYWFLIVKFFCFRDRDFGDNDINDFAWWVNYIFALLVRNIGSMRFSCWWCFECFDWNTACCCLVNHWSMTRLDWTKFASEDSLRHNSCPSVDFCSSQCPLLGLIFTNQSKINLKSFLFPFLRFLVPLLLCIAYGLLWLVVFRVFSQLRKLQATVYSLTP